MKIFIFVILASLTLKAEIPALEPEGDAESLLRKGRYVNVTLLPGTPMRIYVAGKERARLNLSRLKLEVTGSRQGRSQKLEVNREGNYYIVENPEAFQDMKIIEVKTVLPKKSETFRFDLQKP